MTGIIEPTDQGVTAITLMVVIAQKSSKAPVNAEVAAEITGLSLSYLAMLATRLAVGGLLRSFRGPSGGFMLAKEADTISLLDIVLAVESGLVNGRTKEEDGSGTFPQVRVLWDRLENLQYTLLRNITLADVLKGDPETHPFLNRVLGCCEQAWSLPQSLTGAGK